MKVAELRELSDAELLEKHAEFKEQLFNLRFQQITGQLDNPRRLGEVRKDIARVLTLLNQRAAAAAQEEA